MATTTGSSGKGGAQQYGVNPMNNAAQGMSQAFNLLNQGMQGIGQQGYGQYDPSLIGNTPTYNASQGNAAKQQNLAQGAAQQYNPTTGNAAQYGAAQGQAALQQDPQAIAGAMTQYFNPYEDQVVQNTTNNMQRSLQEMQQQNSANAAAAGAFGGSRHGLVEATTNAEVNRNIGDMTAALRQQGFDTAAGLGAQDISNQLGVNSANQNAQNQFGLANMDALNQQKQFNAGNRQQMNLANMDARNQAGQYNASNRQQTDLFNTDAANQRYQFNTANRQQMNLANMDARNQQRQFNTDNRMTTNLANQSAQNQAGQFNAQQSNQQTQDLMSMVNQLGGLAGQSFGMGNQINQNQMNAGGMSQAMLQNILSGGQGLYEQYMNQPQDLLNMRLGAVGMNPLGGAGKTTESVPNTMGGNLLSALGSMISFAPIPFPSSERFKHSIAETGRMVRSVSGKIVPEVSFIYNKDIDPSGATHIGVVAEHLGPDDPAVKVDASGRPEAVYYSQLEVVA